MFKSSSNLLFMLGCWLVISSGCMKSTTLTVLKPAQLTLPEHISKVAVVDRSKPSNGWANFFEGLLTGEQIGQDRRSRQEAVSGLTRALTRTPRFQVISTGIEMEGSKAGGSMPNPLNWSEIDRICKDYGTDAVVAIESFDSDNSTSTRRNESKKKDKDGKEYIVVDYSARQRTGVRIGWRMYDPKSRRIIDEYVTDDYLEKDASGDTEKLAVGNLPSQANVTRDVANIVGHEYCARIAPLYVKVDRKYYDKSKGYKDQMKQAARYLRTRNYEKAGDVWKKIEASPAASDKARGRAAYNMAVAAEMNGSFDLAIEWAKKSYEQYGNKKAKSYIRTLQQRKRDANRVESQMPDKNKV
ncbi:MAG: tetratricopeptide repeat protein [Saprospiraceae bacterium]|nr:tetratricopeptide repeat protein [Saprospiraceae bacterium]